MSRIGRSTAVLLCAVLMASQAGAQLNRANLSTSMTGWFTPNIGLTSNPGSSDKKSGTKAKKASKTKKKCNWPTEKEWNRCERVKTMPGQPGNCGHLLPKC